MALEHGELGLIAVGGHRSPRAEGFNHARFDELRPHVEPTLRLTGVGPAAVQRIGGEQHFEAENMVSIRALHRRVEHRWHVDENRRFGATRPAERPWWASARASGLGR